MGRGAMKNTYQPPKKMIVSASQMEIAKKIAQGYK
jgi:hypothetical protein